LSRDANRALGADGLCVGANELKIGFDELPVRSGDTEPALLKELGNEERIKKAERYQIDFLSFGAP
jgi:hypothetical protein